MPRQKKSLSLARLTLSSLAVVTLVMFGLSQTKVLEIECQTSGGHPCPDKLLDNLSAQLVGKPMLLTDWQKILANQPDIAGRLAVQKIAKRLPGTLLIILQPQPNLFGVKVDEEKTYLVSISGKYQLNPEPDTTLPLISVPTDWQPVSEDQFFLPQLQQQLVTTLANLAKRQVEYRALFVTSDQNLQVVLTDGKKVLLSSNKPGASINQLAVILQSTEYQQLSADVREIDLRFALPVLRN